MNDCLSWPLKVDAFRGVENLARRVSASQARGFPGNYALVDVNGGQRLKVEFFRRGFFVRCEFSGKRSSGLILTSADFHCRGKLEQWVIIRTGKRGGGRIGFAFDQNRGYMVAYDRQGKAETLALPFTDREMRGVSAGAKRAYCSSGCMTVSGAVLLLLALSGFSEPALVQTLALVSDLREEAEHQFGGMMRSRNLSPGAKMTKLRLGEGYSPRF
jgi:hypothetical protein